MKNAKLDFRRWLNEIGRPNQWNVQWPNVKDWKNNVYKKQKREQNKISMWIHKIRFLARPPCTKLRKMVRKVFLIFNSKTVNLLLEFLNMKAILIFMKRTPKDCWTFAEISCQTNCQDQNWKNSHALCSRTRTNWHYQTSFSYWSKSCCQRYSSNDSASLSLQLWPFECCSVFFKHAGICRNWFRLQNFNKKDDTTSLCRYVYIFRISIDFKEKRPR